MTLMQRIHRAAHGGEPRWDQSDVERVWQGLKRKRRRRAVAAGAGVAGVATAAVALWAILVAPGGDALVGPAGRSAPPSHRDETVRFADGSTVVPWGGHEAPLTVVEDTPLRVVVALAKGGARFEVVPRPERVFSVRAGEVTVSVLGTAFSVERVADRVGVAVTRGAVRVDWGAGARRLVAGDDGWFPPLVVSSHTGERDAEATAAETTAKEAEPARDDGLRSGVDRPKGIVRKEERKPAATRATAPRASSTVRSKPPAVPPTTDPPSRTAAIGRAMTDAATLMADADRARLAGRFQEGAALLERLVREHPGDPRAPVAAFSLGRLLAGELGRPAEAARAFARVRALAPNGPLAQDALAREAEAWTRAGEPDRARASEAEYRARIRTESGPRP